MGSVAALVERPERGDPGAEAFLERQAARIVDRDDAERGRGPPPAPAISAS